MDGDKQQPEQQDLTQYFPPEGGPIGPVLFGQESPQHPEHTARGRNGATPAKQARKPKADKPTKTTVRGRKDPSSKQEKTIDTGVIASRVPELVILMQQAADASAAYGDAIKNAAEAAGLQASVVRKYVAARAGEQYDDRVRDAKQLVLLFDSVT